MNDTALELMRNYLDDRISAGDLAELERLLETDAAARARFRAMAALDEGLCDLAALPDVSAGVASPAEVLPDHISRFPRLILRPLAAAAAGLVIGAFGTSAVWAYVGPYAARAVGLLRESFESGPPPLATGIPVQPGRWSGDYSEVVGERQEVTPVEGGKMLRFLRSDYEGKDPAGGYVADMHQLIDLRPYQGAFGDGGAVVQVSARFNAGDFPEPEKYLCGISIYALEAAMAMDGSTRRSATLTDESLAMLRQKGKSLDRDPATWQWVVGEMRLPPNADFLLIRLGVSHATPRQRREIFGGHYADDVRISIARRAPLP